MQKYVVCLRYDIIFHVRIISPTHFFLHFNALYYVDAYIFKLQ